MAGSKILAIQDPHWINSIDKPKKMTILLAPFWEETPFKEV